MLRRLIMSSFGPLLITGYFANWKRLLPRKLSPDSIDPRIALSSVITPMIEKTPMATPSIVSTERNLFVPSAPIDIRKVSETFISYSYRSASIGSKRDADKAGANPETMPVAVDTIMPTITRLMENWIGKLGAAAAIAVVIRNESAMQIG